MSTEVIKKYLEKAAEGEGKVSSPEEDIVIDPDVYLEGELDDDFELEGEAEDTHIAGPSEEGGKHGLVHEDGTKCDAQKEENCPEEAKAAKADSTILGGGVRKMRKPGKVTNTRSSDFRRRRIDDPEFDKLILKRGKLYREKYAAVQRGDEEEVARIEEALKELHKGRKSSEWEKEKYQKVKEREAKRPEEERRVSRRLLTVKEALRYSMDKDKIMHLTKERDELQKKLDELMVKRGKKRPHPDLPYKAMALHSKKWNQLQHRIQELSKKSMYAAKHPEKVDSWLSRSEMKELEELKKEFEIEGAREKMELEENERRGMKQYREYLGWGRRIVVVWRSGKWHLAPEKMDRGDYEFVRERTMPKPQEKTYSEFDKLRLAANGRRQTAKKWGISESFFNIVGEEYKEETGVGKIFEKPFREWCAKKGIKVESWEEGKRREYLRLVGGDAA